MQQQLINIDYLIVNFDGQPFGDFPETSKFKLMYHDYGTKIFVKRSDLYFQNEKIGTFTSVPRSAILSENFAQFQFENHLFYTYSLDKLKSIMVRFCEQTNYKFKSINRLDICIDKHDTEKEYTSIYNNIINGKYLISGRPKNISSYYETHKGTSTLNGFTVGKRSSAKLLRVYNKTLSLQITEKPYINEYYKQQNFENQNVWRFEYQLNSTFFTDLKKQSPINENITEVITWQIFDLSHLVKLLKIANTGFFELHKNTKKSQINKEVKIKPFINFDAILKKISSYVPLIVRIKNKLISTLTIKKRLAKSLFREYYSNGQEVTYILCLNRLLLDVDLATGNPLKLWFRTKYKFYLHEFHIKEKIINHFDTKLFQNHQNLFI